MQSQETTPLDSSSPDGRGAPHDAAEVLEQIRSGQIATVIVGGCDLNGVFRGKRVPADRFVGSVEPTVEFSEFIWALDLDENPQPRPPEYEGWWPDWSTGFCDMGAAVDLDSLRRAPWLDRTAIALCDYRFIDGREHEVAPRTVLRRVLDRFASFGLQPWLAPEYEFIVFQETEASARDKGFRDLRPLAPRPMQYGVLQGTIDNHLIGRLVEGLTRMRVPTEAWNPEGGAPGQYEINLAPAPGLEAADVGFLFKHGVKELCALQEMTATFMPKLAGDLYGSSLHVHQSLWRDDTSAFYDSDAKDRISPVLRSYVAGQLQTLRAFAAVWLPTPTAFKRTRAYSAAGTTETWGHDNKTLSLRVLARDPKTCRVEHRVAGADANIYLTIAAMLAGGIYGIENGLELPPATTGDAYGDPGLKPLPSTLDAAIEEFEASPVANEYLGEQFVRHYAATRRWEVEQSQQHVNEWELGRYFVRS